MKEPMTAEKYLETQAHIMTLSSLIGDMDLAGFIRRIETAETLGVFHMPPLEYSRALPKVDVFKRLAHALMGVQTEVRKLRTEAATTWSDHE